MKNVIKQKGWLTTAVVGGSIVDSKYLLENGFTEADIKKAKDELSHDIAHERVKIPANANELEKQLMDPKADVFFVAFEGQHRSVSMIATARLSAANLFSRLTSAVV